MEERDVQGATVDIIGHRRMGALDRAGIAVLWRAQLDELQAACAVNEQLARERDDAIGREALLSAGFDAANAALAVAQRNIEAADELTRQHLETIAELRAALQSSEERLIEAQAAALPREPLPEPPDAQHWRLRYEREKSAHRVTEAKLRAAQKEESDG